ncbi:MAG: hypothetical protein IPK10_20510 [Bacteroidetes bacterium]|nr:hypothetical protein [Bacteroidota bacterium]
MINATQLNSTQLNSTQPRSTSLHFDFMGEAFNKLFTLVLLLMTSFANAGNYTWNGVTSRLVTRAIGVRAECQALMIQLR